MVQSFERDTHDDIHIVARHIHNFLVIMGVILCLLSRGCISLCTSLSLYWKPFTYLWESTLTYPKKTHDPFEVDYITHEKTSNKLFIHNNGKGITFTLKESTNGSSSSLVGGSGRGEFFHSIILIL